LLSYLIATGVVLTTFHFLRNLPIGPLS
jgi:hypothetical protein